jgi:hypothetical protein
MLTAPPAAPLPPKPLAQGKAAEALELLDGPLGSTMRMAAERRAARAALLAALGRGPEAAALYREALAEQPDDWASMVLYLDCMLPVPQAPDGGADGSAGGGAGARAAVARQAPLAGFWGVAKALRGGAEPGPPGAGPPEAAPGAVAAAADEAAAFISSLPTTAPSSYGGGKAKGGGAPLRGPAIARVELAARRAALGLLPERALAEAVLECYEK